MPIPKIIFRYSWIYDQTWKGILPAKNQKNYPSQKEILSYIKKIEKLWQKDEKKILTELAKVARLKWKEKSVFCYVVGKCKPFSDPLTMPVYRKYPDYFIDILIHELIHNLLVQNFKGTKKSWKYFYKKYKEEEETTIIHIPIHAIHSHIYLNLYNEKRLKRDIRFISHVPAYKRAWQIVRKEGYKNLIKEFVGRAN